MKKTLATQKSTFLKLNETVNKINNEENQNRQINFHDQYTKINHNELQDNLKEKMQPLIESILIEKNQVCEMKEFQNQENVNNSKIIIKNKNEISNLEQDIYSFSTREINDELQNVSCIYNIILFLCFMYNSI